MCACKIVCCTTVFSFAVVRQISYYIIQTAESIREVFKQWRVKIQLFAKCIFYEFIR